MSRAFITFLLFSIFLSACTAVEFEEVKPKSGKEYSEFPKEFIGEYYDIKDKDTLKITKESFLYGDKNSKFHLTGNLRQDSNPSMVLKKIDDLYILNLMSIKDKSWTIIPFQKTGKNISVYYISMENDSLTKDVANEYTEERLKLLESITAVDINTDSTKFTVNPNDKEFKLMIKNGFFEKILVFAPL